MLVLLAISGIPFQYVAFFAVFIFLMMFLRGHIYKKVEHYLRNIFPSITKLNPKFEKAIIIVVFLILYIILKEIILLILKLFGIDIQKEIIQSINESAK